MATTTYYLSPISLLIQIFSNIGIPLQGGFVAVYQAGTNTPVTTYADSTGTTANQNPIPLSPVGRLQSAGGTPVAVWIAAGVAHKMVITDSAGNFILGLDNLTAINDPSALVALLATVSTSSILGGADLIANAMRSYDVIASVRAAQVPNLASGQTLIIDVEGGTVMNDGNGGVFYWSPTSVAVDDGRQAIKPNAIIAPAPGRYLRQANTFGTPGGFLLTVQGCTTAPSVQVTYVQNGNAIIAEVGLPGGGVLTSNATTFGYAGWPAVLQDSTVAHESALIRAMDNSVSGLSAYATLPSIAGGNVLFLTPNNASGAWTNAGTKGVGKFSLSYFL
jgi:hypothetical protein